MLSGCSTGGCATGGGAAGGGAVFTLLLAELFEKADDYLRAGAGLVWVVDAESEIVYEWRAGRKRSTLVRGDRLEGGEVLPGFALEIDELLAEPFGGEG